LGVRIPAVTGGAAAFFMRHVLSPQFLSGCNSAGARWSDDS
jgi:hypothetical protein